MKPQLLRVTPNLSVTDFTELLYLAGAAERERERERRAWNSFKSFSAPEVRESLAFTEQAEKAIERFIRRLSVAAQRDIGALVQLGRGVCHSFSFARQNPSDSPEILPWILAGYARLRGDLVAGLTIFGRANGLAARN